MKKHLSTVLLVLVLLVGLSLLLYPTFSNWWNSFHASRAIAGYSQQVSGLDEAQYQKIWEAAWAYNQSSRERTNSFLLKEEQQQSYGQLLNVAGNGIMGYIEIPSINVILPIGHGTGEAVLQTAAGHLEWTSLPVGGQSSHCVISGHRGLPSAKLFTDLDKLAVGDVFILRILNEILTYEVDQILIVEPDETDPLQIQEGKDLCTLVTCTPYGINSHRLLVRGQRVENGETAKTVQAAADAEQEEPGITAPVVAAAALPVLLAGVLILKKRRRGR